MTNPADREQKTYWLAYDVQKGAKILAYALGFTMNLTGIARYNEADATASYASLTLINILLFGVLAKRYSSLCEAQEETPLQGEDAGLAQAVFAALAQRSPYAKMGLNFLLGTSALWMVQACVYAKSQQVADSVLDASVVLAGLGIFATLVAAYRLAKAPTRRDCVVGHYQRAAVLTAVRVQSSRAVPHEAEETKGGYRQLPGSPSSPRASD